MDGGSVSIMWRAEARLGGQVVLAIAVATLPACDEKSGNKPAEEGVGEAHVWRRVVCVLRCASCSVDASPPRLM